MITSLLHLISKQEEKYKYKLLLQSSFYYCQFIVKHFFTCQRKKTPGQTRKYLTISVAIILNCKISILQNLICFE